MSESIYNTVECEAWNRDLGYYDYLSLHMQANTGGQALSEQGYAAFSKFMNAEMADSLEHCFIVEELKHG